MFSPYDQHLATLTDSEQEEASMYYAEASLPVLLLSTMLVCLIASFFFLRNNLSATEGAIQASTVYALIGAGAAVIGLIVAFGSRHARLTKKILLIASVPFFLAFTAIVWRLLS